jgi:hypothetical protein
MIPTSLLMSAVLVAIVACLILAWKTRRWPEPDSGRSEYGRLDRQQLVDVITRHTSSEHGDLP